MIIGTPIIGVIALIGIMPYDFGNTLISVQSSAMAAPESIVAGRRRV